MAAHLDGCAACRAEAEALREVDRRLQRLGAYRLLMTAEHALQLDRQLGPLLGATGGGGRARRYASALALIVLGAAAILCALR